MIMISQGKVVMMIGQRKLSIGVSTVYSRDDDQPSYISHRSPALLLQPDSKQHGSIILEEPNMEITSWKSLVCVSN